MRLQLVVYTAYNDIVPRRNVWYDARTDRTITAIARALGVGRGEATRTLIDMAGGNFGHLRHQARQELVIIQTAVAILRGRVADAESVGIVNNIAGAEASLAALLANQGAIAPQPINRLSTISTLRKS